MSVTPEQFNEMKARTEAARKKPVCSVCGGTSKGCRQPGITPVEKDILNRLNVQEAARKKPAVFVQSASGNESWYEDAPSQPIITPAEKDILNRMNAQKETGSVRLVLDFWASEGVPRPVVEFLFHPTRNWRFDFAWPRIQFEGRFGRESGGVYLEVQGGIFVQGRHTRGAALLKEWEKLNEATILGWRPLFCQPKELLTVKLTQTIKRALKI